MKTYEVTVNEQQIDGVREEQQQQDEFVALFPWLSSLLICMAFEWVNLTAGR